MTRLIKRSNLIAGTLRFSHLLKSEELLALVLAWKEAEGEHFAQLHLRPGSKGEHIIGFEYILKTDDTQEDFFYRTTDQLKRYYGNGLIGWDISPTIALAEPTNKRIVVRLEPKCGGSGDKPVWVASYEGLMPVWAEGTSENEARFEQVGVSEEGEAPHQAVCELIGRIPDVFGIKIIIVLWPSDTNPGHTKRQTANLSGVFCKKF